MTNAQKWVAGFLVLFLLFFFLEQITKEDDSYDEIGYMSSAEAMDKTAPELMAVNGCLNCHGSDLSGTKLGPSLFTAKEYWSRDDLINYLRNPSSFGSNDRITEYKKEFGQTMMPSYSNLDVKELGKITDYILNLR